MENFITSAESSDLFVGLRFVDGNPQVVFPHGFNISNNEKERRKDVFRLLSVLQKFTEHNDGDNIRSKANQITSFPLMSYQYLIFDFFEHGYYQENEVKYIESLKGKIDWKRTIQKEQPQIDNNNIVYLNFQVKTNKIKENNLITQIHQYCVYQSFLKFGWLFLSNDYLPSKPCIKFNRNTFLSTLYQAFNNTFNDSKKQLFQSMINIINFESDEVDINNYSIGVNKFDGVWERLVDYVFGEENKDRYFPHANWYILENDKYKKSSALEPDTIMKYDNKIYVLDAKYYQFGVTGNSGDLPQTSSIQKQITYGKHIIEHSKEFGSIKDVYNAFIMPYQSTDGNKFKFVSVGTADWEKYANNTMNYAYVLGMLIDTKWLISEYVRHNDKEIEMLAIKIEESLKSFKEKLYENN